MVSSSYGLIKGNNIGVILVDCGLIRGVATCMGGHTEGKYCMCVIGCKVTFVLFCDYFNFKTSMHDDRFLEYDIS